MCIRLLRLRIMLGNVKTIIKLQEKRKKLKIKELQNNQKTVNKMAIGASVQFSCSVMSDSLRHHEPQHSRPPCPSPVPRVHPNPYPLSQWCHPTISSSVIAFSSHLQSFPASGSFQMSQLFTSGGQSIRVSASTSVLPMNTQDWSPLGWTDWISLQSKGLSRVFSNTTVQNSVELSFLYSPTLTSIHDYRKVGTYSSVIILSEEGLNASTQT